MTIEHPSSAWKDYELIDSGGGEKLERFGKYILIRPEPKALWDKTMSEAEWLRAAHVRFKPGAGFARAGKEDSGTWDRLREMEGQWWIRYGNSGGLDLRLRLGLTAFKHVGVFPEQAPNWDRIYADTLRLVQRAKAENAPRPKVLNLFAYTGAASLAAKAAGADVTHLDSVRQVVSWARENMERSGLDGIRWIIEDAMKFARREARRGNSYQGIILDPPAYGHGPDGEKWKLDELLFEMMRCVAAILAPEHSFMILNLYSNGFSALLGETLVREAFGLGSGVTGAGGSDKAKDAALRGTYSQTAQGGKAEDAAEKTGKAGKGRKNAAGDKMQDADGTAPSASYTLESGELALYDSFGKALPLSIFNRLRRL